MEKCEYLRMYLTKSARLWYKQLFVKLGYSKDGIRVVKVQFEHGDLEDAVAMGERSKHDGLTRFAMAERLHYFDMHTPSFQAHFFVTQQLPPSAALVALNDSP
ncbi:hypothetical protein PINS_up012996 [Pythium insidiosum]|nr:hypothetical protein PINS_up012996 [Pythium insidiosum]